MPLEQRHPCPVRQAVPTAPVFAAALERLNRGALLTLLREVISQVDEQAARIAVLEQRQPGPPVPLVVPVRERAWRRALWLPLCLLAGALGGWLTCRLCQAQCVAVAGTVRGAAVQGAVQSLPAPRSELSLPVAPDAGITEPDPQEPKSPRERPRFREPSGGS